MSDIWATNGGIYVGFVCDALEGKPPPLTEPSFYVGDRHILTTGPNGSGKTRRAALVNLKRLLGWSIVYVDLKRELTDMTAAHRAAHGAEVLIYEPFGKNSRGFNPVAAMPVDDNLADDALEHAMAIIKVEGKEPHFGQGAQDLWTGVTMVARLAIPGGTYADVRSIIGMADDDFQQFLMAPTFKLNGKTYPGALAATKAYNWPEIATKLNRFCKMSADNRELRGMISTALTQTRWLDSRPIARELSGPKFDFSELKQRPVTVALVMPPRRLGTHATWLRLMITCIVQALMKDVRRAKVPVLLLLDEYYFIANGGFEIIENNMALFRGYGIKLWTFWQDLSQAQLLYGQHGFETFLANAGMFQSFAPQDLTTAQYLSDRSGQTIKKAKSSGTSITGSPGTAASLSKSWNSSQMPFPMLLPQDFRNMDDGFTVAYSHKAKGPMRLYLPYPSELRAMDEIMKLDPAK